MDRDVVIAVLVGAVCVLSLGASAGALQSPSLPETGDVSYDVLVPDVDVAAGADSGTIERSPGAPAGGFGVLPVLVVFGLWTVGALYVSSVREFVIVALVLVGAGMAAIRFVGDVSSATVGAVTIPGTGSTQTLLAAIGALVALAAAVIVGQPFVRELVRREHGPAWLGGERAGNTDDGASVRREPSSEVGRALHALRERVGLDARTATPREIRQVALDAGYDRSAVEAITERFEVAKYGGRTLSDRELETITAARRRFEEDES